MGQSPSRTFARLWKPRACSAARRPIQINRRYTESIDGNQEKHRQTSSDGEKVVGGRVTPIETGGEEVTLEESGGQLRRRRGERRRWRSARGRNARHRRVAGEGEDDRQVPRARISSPGHGRSHHGS